MEDSVEIKFGEDFWVLRLFKVNKIDKMYGSECNENYTFVFLVNVSMRLNTTNNVYFQVDTSPRSVVRLEKCDQYTPIFSHGDPYVPLMSSLFKYHHA